jgi:uncharacterized protein (TIGR04222 family)
MNPFDLRGPEFLLFYIVLSVVVIAAVVFLRMMSETSETPRLDMSDPILIAYLRGGEAEALRVAAVSLIDRGLLVCSGTQLKTAANARPDSVRRPVEKALLEKYVVSGEAASMFNDPKLKAACIQYEDTLKSVRLLPDESVTQARMMRFIFALVVLGGVGLVKLVLAFQRGRSNVFF